MKQYTDQGKVDIRSGFGTGALCVICCLCCMLSCKPKERNIVEPEEGSWLFVYSFECLVNGEKVGRTEYSEYIIRDNEILILSEPYLFSGYITEEDSNRKIHFKGVDYDNLAFCMALTPEGQGPPPLYNGNRSINPFFFYIAGDGMGPFKEGVNYASPDNVVFYFPENPGKIDSFGLRLYHHYKVPDFQGLEVKLLSSSFRFGYSKSDEEYVPALLDFYFDFEEVITSVPEGYKCSPSVGDTIRVTNGHFVQSLFLHDLSVDHKFVAPQ